MRILRWIAIVGAALVGVLVLVLVGAVIYVGQTDLGPLVSRYASRHLGRSLAVGSLRVHIGSPVTVALTGVSLDNIPGGSAPSMVTLASLNAEIAPASLLHLRPEFRTLSINGLRLLLERGPDGRANWTFGDKPPQPDAAAPAKAASNGRDSFPTMLEAVLHDGEIDFRTSSGTLLRTHLADASVRTPAIDQPIILSAAGSYNDVPAKLDATLQSFNVLHDAAVPFGTDIHIASGDTTLDFKGTMTDPLNVDGAEGKLAIDAPTLDAILGIAGSPGHMAIPVTVAGALSRQGDLWNLTDATGTVRKDSFAGTMRLKEGGRKQPDTIALDLAFPTLDMNGLAPSGGGKDKSADDATLHIDAEPGTFLDAHLAAGRLDYSGIRMRSFDIKAKLAPGSLSIEPVSFAIGGGTARATAAMNNTATGAALQLDATAARMDAGQVARLAGAGPLPLSSTLDAQLSASLEGATMAKALRSNRAFAVVSLTGGTIDRRLVRLAQTDLRGLFSRGTTVPLNCVLAVVDLRNGTGSIAPIRLRSAEGTITGSGTYDLARNWVDVTIGSQRATTGFFALDVPVRISGPVDSPSIRPVMRGASVRLNAGADIRSMPPSVLAAVRRSPCG